jgi:hypothetical protein
MVRRFHGPALNCQCNAQIIVSLGMGRMDDQGASVMRYCVVDAPGLMMPHGVAECSLKVLKPIRSAGGTAGPAARYAILRHDCQTRVTALAGPMHCDADYLFEIMGFRARLPGKTANNLALTSENQPGIWRPLWALN